MFPVENPDHIYYLRENIPEAYFRDNTRACVMSSDGSYTRLSPKDEKRKVDVQEWLMERKKA